MLRGKKFILTVLLCCALAATMAVPAMASSEIPEVPALEAEEPIPEEPEDLIEPEDPEEPEDLIAPEDLIEPEDPEVSEDLVEPEDPEEPEDLIAPEDPEVPEDSIEPEEPLEPEENTEYAGEESVPVALAASDVTVESVAVSPETITLTAEGQTAQLEAVTVPEGGEITRASWFSSDSAVARVNAQTGVVTAGSTAGTTRITLVAVSGGRTYNAYATVTVTLANGFQKDASTGKWYYYRGGAVASGLTQVVEGTVDGKEGRWYVVNGELSTSENVVKENGVWWYINADGMVDESYTGFARNVNGWWYIENGTVTFAKNSVIKDTAGKIGAKNDWWYVVGSKVQTGFTGLANYKNANGWWYISDGAVDFTYNGLAKNKNGWWYLGGGKVNFSYNGFAQNSKGKWYVEDGKVTFAKNSVIKDGSGAIGTAGTWYYVVGSMVQTGFTGLADYKNANGWWYIRDGVVDFTHNGVDKNKNGWWYVVGGKVRFDYTGLADYRNDYGWWYIKNGKVDFTYTGFASNKNGTWYVLNGKVLFSDGELVVGEDGNTYCYGANGIVYGWASLDDGYYFFDRTTGVMKKNTTVDMIPLSSSGKANATDDQIEKIKTMIKARAQMLKLTNTTDSMSEKLRKCFDWSADIAYDRFRYLSQEKSKSPENWVCAYANDAFDTEAGDCFASACSLAFLAKEIGYTDVAVCDTSGHAWARIDGLIYDPGMTIGGDYGKYYASTPEEGGEAYYAYTTYVTEI